MTVQLAQPRHICGSAARSSLPEKYSPTPSMWPRAVAVWIALSGQRKALRHLAQDTHLLADIGLTREQALQEAAKPFWRR